MSEIQSIAQRVRMTIARTGGMELSEADDGRTLEDMGMDSLDRVEAVMSLEDEFSLNEISDADAARLDGLPMREWCQYISARMSAKASA